MKVLGFPLTRITLGFVLGIVLAYYLPISLVHCYFLFPTSFFVLIVLYFTSNENSKIATSFGLATYVLSILIGISTQVIHNQSYQKTNYVHNAAIFEKPNLISLVIREKLKSNSYSDRYIAAIYKIGTKKQTGRIVLNIQKESGLRKFETGTTLRIDATISKNKPAGNPHQFDYGRYLKNKQIYGQLYAKAQDIKIGSAIKRDIWYYSSKLRTRIIDNLEQNNFNRTELNVAVALIMGQQQDIAPDIIRDYQYAGAVHILSVSGLHIGFILIFATFILKPIPNTKRGSFIKLLLILTALFLFGILAGLAPSVVRSVTMFSFIAIGNHLRRSVNIYHTLMVSLLLILLFEPTFLFDVGFQLSYLALFFIIWFQPFLVTLWRPKNKIIKYSWDILTVSFAAQLGTVPLSIYYFHQFPGLFFITNLIVIPLLSIIMVMGVVVMILAALNTIPVFLSEVLESSIYCLNRIINCIASLEQFIFQEIPMHFSLMLCCYLVLITGIIWLKKPGLNKFAMVLMAVIFLQLTSIGNKWRTEREQELVVFNIKRSTVIAERNGTEISIFATDSILPTIKSIATVTNYKIGSLSHIESSKKLQNVLYFSDKKIFIVDSSGIYPSNIAPDVLLLTQSTRINLDRLFLTMKPKAVVADASSSKAIKKLWLKSCAKQKIPFHATDEKGFYAIR